MVTKLGPFKKAIMEKRVPEIIVTVFLKISRHLIFFGKIDWSMNSVHQREGIARDI